MSTKPHTTKKWILIVGGTALTVLVAGLLFQVLQPESGQAGNREKQDTQRTQTASSSPRKQIVARVNGQLISYDQLAKECVARHGKQVLEGIINRTIIEQSFKDKPGAPTRQDVDKEIREIAKKFNLAPDQWMEMMQAQQELTPDQYRRDVIWPMLALRKLAGNDINLTEQEIQEAYEYHYGQKVRARVIVLDRIRQAQQVWELAKKNPENFERLAMEYSVDSSSRALGGAVPPIPRFGNTSKEVEKAAFNLAPGEISGVIQVPENKHWVILKCEGHTEKIGVGLEEVRAALTNELREQKVQKLAHKTFSDLQASARVDNLLTGESTGTAKSRVASQPGSSNVRQVSGARPAQQTQPIQKQ